MNTRMKLFLIISLLISCSIGVFAQTDYYYCKGKEIPLTVNDDKVCVNIPKQNGETSEKILANVKVQERINDESFDIFVLLRSEYEKLKSLDSWKEDAKSVILTSSYRTANGAEVFETPYINIRLKKEQDIDVLTKYAEKYGLKIVKQESLMPLWYILSVSQKTDKNTIKIANTLWESGEFSASVPDLCSNDLDCCSNDPRFNEQWGLHNSDNTDIDISVNAAWNYSTGENVKIAILDTGVDSTHIDLRSNMSTLNYDTETGTNQCVVYFNHGTQCAGIAAAVKDNGIQIAGVAPDATIVSIGNRLEHSTCSLLKRACGIIWAYQHDVDIISNSWRSETPHPAIEDAIQKAFKYGRKGKGCVIAFAAGNNGTDNIVYPANCNDTILVVGSINNTGAKAATSSYGTKLDIVAPGVDILSTIPGNIVLCDSGTSMACPHVAGVAALILERNPELTVTQVNSIICHNAKKISGVNFNVTKPEGSWNEEYGYGLVDAYSSVINTPTIAYIQNDTITGTSIISADNIYVGRDVTDRKEYGDVILGQGDITLKAGYIKIKNSTTVPLGTKLKIENQ